MTQPSSLQTEAWLCQRIKVGPLERGQVLLIFDAHSFHRLPEGCLQVEVTTYVDVLERLWVSDADVAAFLKAYHQVEAVAIQSTNTTEGVTAGIVRDLWTWSAGQGDSVVDAYSGGPREDLEPARHRFLWPTESGAAWLEMTYADFEGPSEIYGGTMQFAEPMLMALETPMPATIAMIDGGMTGQLREFADRSCTERIWP